MNSAEFQQVSKRTLIDAPARSYYGLEMMLVWNCVGLMGEIGELLAAPPEKWEEEAGDLLWYLAALYSKIDAEMPDFDTMDIPMPGCIAVSKSLTIAAAKVTDTIKKQVFHDHGFNPVVLQTLLNEFSSQMLLFCSVLEIDISAAMEMNVAKLKRRYPEGWDTARSINRFELGEK